jgi:hypothetical protein
MGGVSIQGLFQMATFLSARPLSSLNAFKLESGGFAYMTRVEGENTRLRHYLAHLHRQTLCYSLVRRNAEALAPIVTALSQILGCSIASIIHPCIQQRQEKYT